MTNVIKKVPTRKLLVKKVAKTSFVTGKAVMVKEKPFTPKQKEITIDGDLRALVVYVNSEELFDVRSETNNGCCGIEDVINLECSDDRLFCSLSLKDKKEVIKKIDETVSKRKPRRNGGVIDQMLTTDDKPETAEWVELMKLSTVFIPVKTFKNLNSGNMVTIWISNN